MRTAGGIFSTEKLYTTPVDSCTKTLQLFYATTTQMFLNQSFLLRNTAIIGRTQNSVLLSKPGTRLSLTGRRLAQLHDNLDVLCDGVVFTSQIKGVWRICRVCL